MINKTVQRRSLLMSTLFGAGYLGLRALATGIPASVLMRGRRALADTSACPNSAKAQFFVMSTCGSGDPINANMPGTYVDKAYHPAPLGTANLMMGNGMFTAGGPWGGLLPETLKRTAFFHIMTNTPIHPKEQEVLGLLGASTPNEMLPSLLARQMQPCLGTLQAQPIALGARNPSEGLTYAGQALPLINPVALKTTLASPAGPLMNLTKLRDDTLASLDGVYRNSATKAQRAYLDSVVLSQTQLRGINDDLLDTLNTITDNSVDSQLAAALALIQMKVTPVVTVHIPFGGDNHHDTDLGDEVAETTTGVASLVSFMASLNSLGLQDQVTFMTLNVFGRTLMNAAQGRGHNGNHQGSIVIGKAFKSMVIGGVAQVEDDFGAQAIDSSSGVGGTGGDIPPAETLGSFGKTMLASVGTDSATIDKNISIGKVITAALA